jgi:hypothetical protein
MRVKLKKVIVKKPMKFWLSLPPELYEMLQNMAEIHENISGKTDAFDDLVRYAIQYTYGDNERMRECYKHVRSLRFDRDLKTKKLKHA